MTRPSLRPESSLTPRLVRREALQLGVIGALTLLAWLFGPRALQVAAAIVDLIACVLAAVALLVASRASGRRGALALYALSLAVFAALAVLNLHG